MHFACDLNVTSSLKTWIKYYSSSNREKIGGSYRGSLRHEELNFTTKLLFYQFTLTFASNANCYSSSSNAVQLLLTLCEAKYFIEYSISSSMKAMVVVSIRGEVTIWIYFHIIHIRILSFCFNWFYNFYVKCKERRVMCCAFVVTFSIRFFFSGKNFESKSHSKILSWIMLLLCCALVWSTTDFTVVSPATVVARWSLMYAFDVDFLIGKSLPMIYRIQLMPWNVCTIKIIKCFVTSNPNELDWFRFWFVQFSRCDTNKFTEN